MAKVMVAMSGGVDSSLAAALLVEQGYDVTGVTMHLWADDDGRLAESLCCAQEMAESARRVCAQLGIPYYVFNYQQEFRRHVIDYFVREYAAGLTPNPCLECNRAIKFRALLKRAAALGFDYVATGHYARITSYDDLACGQRFTLQRALDQAKDQSYMLFMLEQADLARLLFPIGGYSKAEVRALAAARGLDSADRPESQDICFVPGGDYRNLLREEAPTSLLPGPIVDEHGRELGQHQGLPLYTVGQRKGLGLGGGHPRYVTALDVARNTLVVGPNAATERACCVIDQLSFVVGAPPVTPFDCLAQVRSHAPAVPVTVHTEAEGRLALAFHAPQRALTPGQAAVLYEGDRVLGGGRIVK